MFSVIKGTLFASILALTPTTANADLICKKFTGEESRACWKAFGEAIDRKDESFRAFDDGEPSNVDPRSIREIRSDFEAQDRFDRAYSDYRTSRARACVHLNC